jgi:hypothetical protein
MPPAYVKPYVKRQKNDAADAEAICEAGAYVAALGSQLQETGVVHPERSAVRVGGLPTFTVYTFDGAKHILPILDDSEGQAFR